MNEPVRILLRVVGLVLFVGSLAGVAYIVGVGPNEVGHQMGQECRRGGNQLGPAEYCTWQDVLGILKALPFLTLVGAVLVLVSRRDSVEEKVRSGRGSRLRLIVAVAAVLVIPVNFAGVFIYSAAYTIDHQVKMTKKIISKAPGLPERPGSGKAKAKAPVPAADAPRGLDRGSLLEADAFKAAMAQVRRVAPAGARLTSLRVSAARIDAEVLAGGKVLTVSKPWDAKARVVSRAAATEADEPLIAFAALDTAAPQRATMAGARSAGVTVRDVDYLVLFDAVGLRWNGFLTDGKGLFSTSPDGRRLR